MERKLGDDDRRATRTRLFEVVLTAQYDPSSTRCIRVGNAFLAQDDTARGKVRPLDNLGKLGDRCGWMGNQVDNSIDQFPEVVRRNIRRHANGDTVSAV